METTPELIPCGDSQPLADFVARMCASCAALDRDDPSPQQQREEEGAPSAADILERLARADIHSLHSLQTRVESRNEPASQWHLIALPPHCLFYILSCSPVCACGERHSPARPRGGGARGRGKK
jgi:hypothetical protein